MNTLTAENGVARRNDVAVKADAEVIRKAKIVAAYRDVSLAEYISSVLGPAVERDLESEQEKERKGRHAPKGGKKPES